MAWGLDNTASQDEATAWGRNTNASANYATSWGRDTNASGELSTAFGYQNNATNDYGLAFGYQNTASGRYATVWGGQNTASGQYSTAFGAHSTASGDHSLAVGYYSEASAENGVAIGDALANSNYMTAFGRFNENVAGQSLTNWVDTDQLFVVGNGTGWQNANRSNALTILKNGSMTINAPIDGARLTQQPTGTVDLAIATTKYVNDVAANVNPTWQDVIDNELAITPNYIYAETPSIEFEDDGAQFMIQSKPSRDFVFGAANVLSFSFNGGLQTATIGDARAVGSQKGIEYAADYSADYSNRSLVDKEYVDNRFGVFQRTGNIVSNEGVNYATDNFVFGSPQMDDDHISDHDHRIFYNKNKGAFRAGIANSSQWDDANVGLASFAGGYNNRVSGDYAVAFGNANLVNQNYAFAQGDHNRAMAPYAIAFGRDVIVDAQYGLAIGRGAEARGDYALSLGYYTLADANNSVALGNTRANSYYMTALGQYNNIVNQSTDSWIDTDQLFVVGNGVDINNRSNALTILKNGTIMAPTFSLAEINTAGNTALVTKEYVDNQLMWEILAANGGGGGMRIQPKNNSVRQIFVQRDDNNYTQVMVRNDNDAGNGAGAIIELKGSGADYTNNMYIGKYGASFWIPELQDNGAVLTDKNLVIGTASDAHEIHFVTGHSYTNLAPVVIADDEGRSEEHTSELQSRQ